LSKKTTRRAPAGVVESTNCRDPESIRSRIPLPYKAGVRNLGGLEFTCTEDREKVDALRSAPVYDLNAVRRLFWQYDPWPYVEYGYLPQGLELNGSLPPAQSSCAALGNTGSIDTPGAYSLTCAAATVPSTGDRTV
jgi:hypothetical protein